MSTTKLLLHTLSDLKGFNKQSKVKFMIPGTSGKIHILMKKKKLSMNWLITSVNDLSFKRKYINFLSNFFVLFFLITDDN